MECQSKKCQYPAAYTVYWPGKTILQCSTCAEHSQRVAQALGFMVSVVAMESNEMQEVKDAE